MSRESLILSGSFTFDDTRWSGISHACKHLICKLLTVDPSQRATTAQALTHPWFTGNNVEALGPLPTNPPARASRSLRHGTNDEAGTAAHLQNRLWTSTPLSVRLRMEVIFPYVPTTHAHEGDIHSQEHSYGT